MIEERRYSLSEIDAMRAALEKRTPYPQFAGQYLTDYQQQCVWRTQQIEGELRTYMLGGVDPSEFVALSVTPAAPTADETSMSSSC